MKLIETSQNWITQIFKEGPFNWKENQTPFKVQMVENISLKDMEVSD